MTTAKRMQQDLRAQQVAADEFVAGTFRTLQELVGAVTPQTAATIGHALIAIGRDLEKAHAKSVWRGEMIASLQVLIDKESGK